MAPRTGMAGLILEIRGIRFDPEAIGHLLEILEDSVVVRPNGETLQIVRDQASLRYVTVDAQALVRKAGSKARATTT